MYPLLFVAVVGAVSARDATAQRFATWYNSQATLFSGSLGTEVAADASSATLAPLLVTVDTTQTPNVLASFTWNGTSLTQISGTQPTVRGYFGFSSLNTSGSSGVVLFGGQDSAPTALSDTWVFHNGAWSNPTPSNNPGARVGARIAMPESGSFAGQAILFGGYTVTGSLFTDTWRFDGTNWTQISTSTSPPAMDCVMCSDGNGGMLLHGHTSTGTVETWQLTGATPNWVQLSPTTSPASRSFSAVVYDSIRRLVVLAGGRDPTTNTVLTDTWTLDLSVTPLTWTQESPTTAFSPSSGSIGMFSGAFDSSRGECVFIDQLIGDVFVFSTATSMVNALQPPTSTCTCSTIGIQANSGQPRLGSTFTIDVVGASTPPSAPVFLAYGVGPVTTGTTITGVSNPNVCQQFMTTVVGSLFASASSAGTASFAISVGSNPSTIGAAVEFEGVEFNGSNTLVCASGNLEIVIGR